MKKSIVWVLIAMMAGLSACGSEQEAVAPADPAPVVSEEEPKEAEVQEPVEETDHEEEINSLLAEGLDYLHASNGKERDPQKARECFEKAAEYESPEAQFLAGYVIERVQYGGSDGKEMPKAVEYFEKCANVIPLAKMDAGAIYCSGQDGAVRDKAKGKAMVEEARNEVSIEDLLNDKSICSAELQVTAAWLMFDGYLWGMYADGYKMATIAESSGSIEAIPLIGYMYMEVWGVDVKDYGKAFEYTAKAYEMTGDRIACQNLGWMYDQGLGVDQDFNKALEYFNEGASKGNAESYNQLAVMYENGRGVDQDMEKAIEFYEKAIELGSAKGMNNYGITCMENGDYAKAKELFEMAIDYGNGAGYTNLAGLYMNGYGVEQDIDKAVELTQKGVDANDPDALANLGALYYMGQGVEMDQEKAKELFVQAARDGSENGKAYCDQLGLTYN